MWLTLCLGPPGPGGLRPGGPWVGADRPRSPRHRPVRGPSGDPGAETSSVLPSDPHPGDDGFFLSQPAPRTAQGPPGLPAPVSGPESQLPVHARHMAGPCWPPFSDRGPPWGAWRTQGRPREADACRRGARGPSLRDVAQPARRPHLRGPVLLAGRAAGRTPSGSAAGGPSGSRRTHGL